MALSNLLNKWLPKVSEHTNKEMQPNPFQLLDIVQEVIDARLASSQSTLAENETKRVDLLQLILDAADTTTTTNRRNTTGKVIKVQNKRTLLHKFIFHLDPRP